MTTLATKPDLEQTQSLDYEWDLPHDAVDDYAGDPLTSIAFDINKHQRSIETLQEASRAFCDDILTMKQTLHELQATIADLQVDQTFSIPDDQLF